MKTHLARLGKQTIVYGLSGALLQGIGLITLPVFARKFSPAEYGALEIATVGLSLLLVLADLGMASASQRSYYDYADGQVEERRSVLATALVTSLAAALVLGALLILLREPVAHWLFNGRPYTELIVLVAVCVPLSVVATFTREVMRLRLRPWLYTGSATCGALVTGGLGIGLVLGTGSGIKGVLIGTLAGNVVAVAFGLAVVGRDIGPRLSRDEFRIMTRFGLPLIPAAAALWGLAFLDRLMLGRLTDLDDVGQYAVGARYATVVMFAVTAFGLAWSPFLLSVWNEDAELEKHIRGRTLTYLALGLTTLSVVLAVFAREATTVIAPQFDEAYKVVGVLCFGVTVFGLSSVTMAGISLARRSGYFAIYSSVAVVVNVILNFALIPPLGGVGAGLATACAYVVLTVLYYWKAQHLYPTPYEPRKVLVVLALGIAVVPLGWLPLGLGFVALKLVALALFAGALLAARVVDEVEMVEIRSLARRLTGRPQAA